MREIPHFKEGMDVDIDVTEKGFIVTKSKKIKIKRFPFHGSDLIKDLTPETAHADLLVAALSNEIRLGSYSFTIFILNC